MLGRTDHRRRLFVVLAVVLLAAGAATARAAQWQVVERDRLVALAEQQTTVRVEERMQRGTIYDRTGTVVLASTVDRDRLVGSPSQLRPAERASVADALVTLLGLDGDEAARLRDRFTTDTGYTVLRTGLDRETSDRIRDALADGTIAGVSLEPQPERVYPQTGGGRDSTLAAHLLGFVNQDGVGQYGVEAYYQDALAGSSRILDTQRDVTGRPMWDTARVRETGVAGSDVRLTIDASLQLRLEQEVFAAWVANGASSVSGVVLDPRTGEVLAEATYPSYDGNDYSKIATEDPGRFLDPVVSAVYEPGSVAKMLLAAAAYDRKVVTAKTRVNDSGVLKVQGGRVYDADHQAKGRITFQDVVAYSRNVGVSRVALKLAPTLRASAAALYQTWTKFGIGSKTGVDLAFEVPGLARDPALRHWTELDLANASFGQGVAVTPMQLAVAYAAMVNGGYRVTPRVVAAIGDRELPKPPQERIISEGLSKQLVSLMHHVVEDVEYYRVKTDIHGYLVGGKTGTAEVWDPALNGGRGAFKRNVFDFSFVGYVGQWQPDVLIAVTIRDGRPTIYGQGSMELPIQSFDLFRRIAQDAISVLGIAPRLPENKPSPSPSASPSTPGTTPAGVVEALGVPTVTETPPSGPSSSAPVDRGTVPWSKDLEVPAGSTPRPGRTAAP
jgi:cell division protein FtsI (penicillin-binding protein 3)